VGNARCHAQARAGAVRHDHELVLAETLTVRAGKTRALCGRIERDDVRVRDEVSPGAVQRRIVAAAPPAKPQPTIPMSSARLVNPCGIRTAPH
jgi:hypothetical protein